MKEMNKNSFNAILRKSGARACLLILFLHGPAMAAAPPDTRQSQRWQPMLFSKLDLPLFRNDCRQSPLQPNFPGYAGSSKSFAAEPKGIKILGHAGFLGLALVGLTQPVAPIGFLLVALINAKGLIDAVTEPSPRPSETDFLWSKGGGFSPDTARNSHNTVSTNITR